MTLLMAVERHLRANAVSASRFGRQVSGDPRLVFDLRRGREPRPAMAARVLAHIAGTTLVQGHENVPDQRGAGA